MRDVIRALSETLSTGKRKAEFLALAAAVVSAYLVATNVFVPSLMEVNPSIEPGRVVLVVLIAFFTSLLLFMLYCNRSMFAAARNKTGVAGVLGGLLTSACPICPPLVASWLGLGGSLYFLADYGFYVGIASLALILYSLYSMSKNVSHKTCLIKKKRGV